LSHYLALENQGLLRIRGTLARRVADRWMSGYTSLLAFTPDGKTCPDIR
jgi:hypothetical protein